MARLSDLSLKNRLFMGTYRYRSLEPVPWSRPRRPLRESRVALVTTAGLHSPDQPPFDCETRGGDASFRVLPRDADVQSLAIAHRSDAFDQDGLRADRNLGLPLDRLTEMEVSGAIGSLAPRALSFMGSISAPLRLVRQTAPAAAALLAEDGADAALLVPF